MKQHNHMQQVICIFPKKHEWNQGQASRDIIKNNDGRLKPEVGNSKKKNKPVKVVKTASLTILYYS